MSDNVWIVYALFYSAFGGLTIGTVVGLIVGYRWGMRDLWIFRYSEMAESAEREFQGRQNHE